MKKNLPVLKLLLLPLIILFASKGLKAQSIWNATNDVSPDMNWSTAANWLPTIVPGPTSDVLFIDPGAAGSPGTIDNIVDENTTIQQLAYRQTNGVHNTLISPGVTLTISNGIAATNLLVGMETTDATYNNLTMTTTISGVGGTLAITSTNVGSVLSVRQINTTAGSHVAVLDMSGLDNFNASIGKVWVGTFPGNTTTRPQGQMNLAKTNNITTLSGGTKTTPAIDVGDTGSSPDVGSILSLGISNNIAADSIVIGNQRSDGTLNFNPSFTGITTPSLYLRGTTNSRVSIFNIGDNSSATASIGSKCSGLVDFSGGTVDVMVDSMILGDGQTLAGTGAGTSTGTFTLAAGIVDVNTLEIGYQNSSGATEANIGTLNINGGTLRVNSSLRLAKYDGAGGQSSGSIFLQAPGIIQANNIVAGGGNTSDINLFGGTLIVSNTIGSTLSPLSALTVYARPIMEFSVVSGVIPCQVKSLSGDGSGIVRISSLPPIASYPTQFSLITYQSDGSGLNFTLDSLPDTFQGSISNDNSGTIYLIITSGPSLASVTWAGTINNLWDLSTFNWTNAANASAKYQDPDVVTFNDSASTGNVNVSGIFAPAGWVQNNNTLNYTFSGTGSITGQAGLVVNGIASVTLAEAGGDNFSGGIQVNAGSLVLDDVNSAISGGLTIANGATTQIGNNDINGSLPSGTINDEGVLVFNRTDSMPLNEIVGGGGAVIQKGSGSLIITGPNSYTGTTSVTGGVLALTNSGSIADSAQVNVTGATLNVSGATNITILNNLNLTNATLTLSVGYPQTNVNVSSLKMGGDGNTLNITSLPTISLYPTVVTVLKSASPIAGFNMSLGLLPAGSPPYSATVTLSSDNTAILLTLNSGPLGLRPNVTWTGVDALDNVNTNWSDDQNWQLPGAPTSGDNVLFNDTAAAANSALTTSGGGTDALVSNNINNIVDRSFSIASLTYTNKTGAYQNTFLAENTALNITNFFTVGGLNSSSTLIQQVVNIAGGQGSSLSVNNPSNNVEVWVGNSGTQASYALLDMSALDNFAANVNSLLVGATVGNIVNRPGGILYLAKTNIISAGFQSTNDVEAGSITADVGIDIGDCNQNQGPVNFVYLGRMNTISADSIVIARQKDSSSMMFNQIYSNTIPYSSVTFQGYSSSLVSNFDVGDGAGNTGTTSGTGDLNLNGGRVTAAVDTLNVGRASSGASGVGTTTGSLEFDAGTITANTVNIGFQPVSGTKVGIGTINVNSNSIIGESGTLVVNGNLNLGVNVNNGGTPSTSGTLNINGGTVQANNIIAGTNGAPSTINLAAGTLNISGTVGTSTAPLTTLALADGTTLQLAVNGFANVPAIAATTITTSGTINLKISSLTGAVTNVMYPLISYTGADPYSSLGNFSLPSGYAGSLIDSSGTIGVKLTVAPALAPQSAHITDISVSGTILNISATNGLPGESYVLLGTTNLTTPLDEWTPILTNSFNGIGNLTLSTNIVNPALPQQFYLILSQ